jgi:uncharacterized protein (DUF885 family)
MGSISGESLVTDKKACTMRILALVFAVVVLQVDCVCRGDQAADEKVQRLAKEFIAGYLQANPLEAVDLGKHEQDGSFVVPVRGMLAAEQERLARVAQALEEIGPEKLSPAARADWRILRQTVAKERWRLESQRSPWRNPMFYARAIDISIYLKRDFKPLEERVRDMTAILRQTHATFAAAQENLEPVLPKPFVENAIKQAQGMQRFLQDDVAREVKAAKDPAIRRDFEAINETAILEFGAFADWLKNNRLPKADGSYALGNDAYAAMLKADDVDLTPQQVLDLGLRELRKEQERFAAAAKIIDPTSSHIEVYRTIQREHPTADGLLPEARKNVELIRQFLIDHKIVTIPSEVRPLVAETLPPFRATSFASMSTPGPFETKATEAYYYITPVDPKWTPQQQEEWLTAYNYYTTDVLTIHEAYPGHYLQFLALNASPASDVAKIFTSYAFVEGWAHYAEQMMIDEGFGQVANPAEATKKQRIRAAKFRLAQSGEALLRLCRLCCSVRLHTQGMTVDEATRFFIENCYYEAQPARQEATRGTFDPGYLYYTLGKLMILKLREDWKAQEGERFSLQRFHDELLSHGAPSIRLLREIMLKDPQQWSKTLAVKF